MGILAAFKASQYHTHLYDRLFQWLGPCKKVSVTHDAWQENLPEYLNALQYLEDVSGCSAGTAGQQDDMWFCVRLSVWIPGSSWRIPPKSDSAEGGLEGGVKGGGPV